MNHLQGQVVKSFQTLCEMLTDRGTYNLDRLNSISEVELAAMINEKSVFDIPLTADTKIIYFLMNKFKKAPAIDLLSTEGTKKVFFISRDPLTNINLNTIYNDIGTSIDIEFFHLKELQFNISNHYLVPKHELIRDPTLIQELVTSYSLKSKLHMPLIQKSDPMARYLNAKPGDIVKITRVSPSAGEYICYRCCV
jgi:DNA-directed RNA polymerase subunit H (RpoH/RPB5)